MKSLLRTNIAEMDGYVPGFQPDDMGSWIKLNTNENSYPPSPKVVEAILAELGTDGARLHTYPAATSQKLREVAGELYGFDPTWIIMANGSDEVLNNLIRACASEGDEIGYVHPSYSYYATLARIQGARVRTFSLTDDFRIADFPDSYEGKIFFLTTPNAPLGPAFPLDYIEELATRCTGLLVLDETYADFAGGTALELVRRHKNVVVTRSLSKSYALAGMRLGLAIGRPEIIAALDKIRDHYNLDRLAQAACVAALRDQDYLRDCCNKIRETREWFATELRARGYHVIPSQGNYLLGNDRPGADSPIRISEISYVKPDGSTDVVAISDGGQTASLQTRYGWVQVWSNGNWEYTPDPVLAHVGSDLFNDVLTYKIIDKDGDTSTNTKSISVNDTIPIISNPTQSIVYESSPFHTVFTGSLPVIRVADPFKVVFNDPASGGELYTADGQLITYSSTESVLTAHVYGDPTNIAFTITIKNATSTNAYFEFDLYQKLDHTLFTDTQFLDLSIAYKVQETDFVGSDIVTSFPNYPVSTADAAVFHVIVVDDTIVNSPTTGDDILLFDGTFSAPPFNGTPPVDMLGGTDTLLFPKTLTTLDFSTLNGKITNLEIIDLSVDGANSITNILGADVNAVTSSNSLYILGTSEDHVALNGFTQSNSDPLIYNLNGSNHLLNEYTNAVSGSTVFVEKDISMP